MRRSRAWPACRNVRLRIVPRNSGPRAKMESSRDNARAFAINSALESRNAITRIPMKILTASRPTESASGSRADTRKGGARFGNSRFKKPHFRFRESPRLEKNDARYGVNYGRLADSDRGQYPLVSGKRMLNKRKSYRGSTLESDRGH